MCEQKLEEMVATIYVDDQSAMACSENGIPLAHGWKQCTYTEAVVLIRKMEALFLSVPEYQKQRFHAMANSIRSAFGPEFFERHPDMMALDRKAFAPRTRFA